MAGSVAKVRLSRDPNEVRRLLRVGWALLALLVVQNLLGLALNLYVALPSSPSFLVVFTSVPLLTAHIALAFLLVAVAAYAVVGARRAGLRDIAWLELLELVFLIVAVQEGFAFTFTQNNLFSFGMEVGFLGAVVTQAVVLYRLALAPRATAPQPGSQAAG